jgi:signal transduction histidine kinase/CheY-like chemotaxis protein
LKTKKPSIAYSPLLRFGLVAGLIILLMGGIWAWRDYTHMLEGLRQDLSRFEEDRREILRRTVKTAVTEVRHLRANNEEQLRADLLDRVGQAEAVINGICGKYNEEGACKDSADTVRESLRQVRFGATGYLFAFDLDGVEQLFPPDPALEGVSMLGLPDNRALVVSDMLRIVGKDGQGFYRYEWAKPDTDGRNHLKISFVKIHRGLNWVIGTGEYLVDYEEMVKNRALKRLAGVRYAEDGYLFAGDWQGLSLLGPVVGENMWEVEDKNGLKIVQELVKAAQGGGGFVEYHLPPFDNGPSYPKISYVEAIEDWHWYVGAGESLQAVLSDIAERRTAGEKRIFWRVVLIVVVVAVLAAILFWGGRAIAHRTKRDFNAVLGFLHEASTKDVELNPAGWEFTEFEDLANAANQMVGQRKEARKEVDRQQIRLTEAMDALEMRVQERTRELQNEIIERQHVEDELQRANELLERRVEDRTKDLKAQIVERELMERQFVQAQKMEAVGQLAGGFAHDLNNILTVIVGTIGGLRNRLKEDEKAQAAIRISEEAIRRAANMTRRLLVFSREADTLPEVLRISDLLRSIDPLITRALRESTRYKVDLAADLWPVYADSNLLENAILNVVLNAQDAMPEDGILSVSAVNRCLTVEDASKFHGGCKGDFVEITIADTGSGIPEGMEEKVFEPFFSTKPKGKGTGLGLSMVRTFAHRSGGFVGIETNPGAGTSIKILLPKSDETVAGATEQVGPVEDFDFGTLKVLVVEDDAVVRNIAVNYMQDQESQISEAADGLEAIDILEGGDPFDLVISDVIMPGGMSGLDLRDLIAKRWPDCKVLLMTGYSADEFSRRDVDWDGIKMIRKPFGRDDLLRAVALAMRDGGGRAISPSEITV